jgi:hypothetical protein
MLNYPIINYNNYLKYKTANPKKIDWTVITDSNFNTELTRNYDVIECLQMYLKLLDLLVSGVQLKSWAGNHQLFCFFNV